MENKINVAELLKDCPKGMELDCTMYDNARFEQIVEKAVYPIVINIGNANTISLTKEGHWNKFPNAKCVIFPKGKTTWEGFHKPFKDGDVVYFITENGNEYITIFKNNGDVYLETHIDFVIITSRCSLESSFYIDNIKEQRLATEEEKQKLFDAIKTNGYKWNSETKTLEKLVKPNFKVGDRIRRKNDKTIIKTIGYIYHDSYALYDGCLLFFKEQDQYELVPDKFEISRLKPFDKVLVRNSDNGKWCGQFYMAYNKNEDYPFECTYNCWKQCIPYEGNEHLRNTTNACRPFYKTWE